MPSPRPVSTPTIAAAAAASSTRAFVPLELDRHMSRSSFVTRITHYLLSIVLGEPYNAELHAFEQAGRTRRKRGQRGWQQKRILQRLRPWPGACSGLYAIIVQIERGSWFGRVRHLRRFVFISMVLQLARRILSATSAVAR
jgi:hypothetical protein